MFGIHMISVYLVAVGLLTLLVLVLVWQKQRSGKTVCVWLTSAVVGILLGSVGPLAILCLADYRVEVVPGRPEVFPAPVVAGADEGAMDVMDAMGGPGGGGPGMGGMGRGGGRPPRPKRDLTTLVRKIDLLTGDVALTLSEEQAGSLMARLAELGAAETMTDEDAQAGHDAILDMFDEDQKSRLDAISPPRRRPGGGGPGGGGPGGPGGGMGGPGGPGGGEQAEDANPFQEESNAQVLTHLRERFGGEEKPAEARAPEAKPAEPKPADKEPAEAKAPEAKPAEPKAPEPKPAEKKPAEPKPAEAKAPEAKAEPKPAEEKPAQPKPAES